MDMNGILTIFIFWILPIIIGIDIYYSPRRYPSVITRIDRFALWIDEKREGIKEDKGNKYLKYIKHMVYISFGALMKLTEGIKQPIRSGIRVTLSIYLSYFLLFVIGLIGTIAIFLVLLLLGLMLYGRFGDTFERELRRTLK